MRKKIHSTIIDGEIVLFTVNVKKARAELEKLKREAFEDYKSGEISKEYKNFLESFYKEDLIKMGLLKK